MDKAVISRILLCMHKISIFLLAILLATAANAQEPAEQEVLAPFVSRLKATTNASSIIITWKDSEDVSGTDLIFRHSEQIGAENWDQAELIARVSEGQQSYTDYPPNLQPYYYAVIVEAADKSKYLLFIPFRNITLTGRQVESLSLPEPEEAASQITSLTAVATADTVSINFEAAGDCPLC